MKKSLSLLTLMLLAGSSFAQNPAEAQKVIDLPLTYVNYDAPSTAYGSIAKGESIIVGYNKIVNGEVGFGLTSWKTNYIGYANIDYSNMVSKIKELKSAILTVECSGSTDSKRTAGIGVGYNESLSPSLVSSSGHRPRVLLYLRPLPSTSLRFWQPMQMVS